VLLAERRFAAALDTIDAIGDPVGIRNPAWNPWRRLRALALHGLGRSAEASALIEEEVLLLRQWGAPSSLGSGLTDLGRVSGRFEPLLEALALLEGSGAQLLLSRAPLALGRHPDLPPGDAATYLRAALDGAVACGADGVAGQACAALKRLGQPAQDVRTRRSSEAVQ
jgi:hypothetical protein